MAVAIPIIIILAVAIVTTIVFGARRQRGGTGSLSRETRGRDAGVDAAPGVEASASTELETTGRERADDTRATYENARPVPSPAATGPPLDGPSSPVSRIRSIGRRCRMAASASQAVPGSVRAGSTRWVSCTRSGESIVGSRDRGHG